MFNGSISRGMRLVINVMVRWVPSRRMEEPYPTPEIDIAPLIGVPIKIDFTASMSEPLKVMIKMVDEAGKIRLHVFDL